MKNLYSFPIFVFAMLAIVGFFAGESRADVIFTNPLTGSNIAQDGVAYITGQTVAANVEDASISHEGVSAQTGQGYSTVGWNTTVQDLSKYISLKFSAASGFAINLENLVLSTSTSGQVPTSFAIRSSVDGFGSNVATPTSSGETISLGGSQFQNLTGDIEFRIYAWDAGNAQGQYSVNSFTFNGTVTAVPEPAAASLLGIGLLAISLRRRRALQTA